jgi:uncharacterized protein YutD
MPKAGEDEVSAVNKVLVRLLEEYSNEFSNHGCNDFFLPNTDENWEFYLGYAKWAKLDEEELVRPPA